MNNCNLSHQDIKVNDEYNNTLRDDYGSVFEDGSGKNKVSCGNVHEYRGMTLDYSVKDQVKITILDYINRILECLDRSEPKARVTKSSTDPLNLIVVDKDCGKLRREKSETFHKLVANILFAKK